MWIRIALYFGRGDLTSFPNGEGFVGRGCCAIKGKEIPSEESQLTPSPCAEKGSHLFYRGRKLNPFQRVGRDVWKGTVEGSFKKAWSFPSQFKIDGEG